MRGDKLAFIGLILMLTVFSAGVAVLFSVRFQSGDVHPPYSSLRSDPLGARGLFESLNELNGVEAVRNHQELNRLEDAPPSVILFAGVRVHDLLLQDSPVVQQIKDLAALGHRVAVGFSLAGGWTDLDEEEEESAGDALENAPPGEEENPAVQDDGAPLDEDDAEKDSEPAPADNENLQRLRQGLKFHRSSAGQESWGFTLKQQRLDSPVNDAHLVYGEDGLPLPPSMEWHGAWHFESLSPDWRPVYQIGENPVLIERKFGRGSVVFFTDSFFLSNESLAGEPQSGLLAWLVGSYGRVVFDERHHGSARRTNIAELARKYGLTGFFITLLAWGLLYVWCNASPLVPRDEADGQYPGGSDQISSRGSAEALTSLLRRNIPAREALSHCLALWEKTPGLDRMYSREARKRAVDALKAVESGSGPDRGPVAVYNEVREILAQDRKRGL